MSDIIDMKNAIRILILCFIGFSITNCSRDTENKTSRLVLKTPDHAKNKLTKLLDGAPEGYNICYGVNVTAPDMFGIHDACHPEVGVFAGFTNATSDPNANEGELEVFVPSGPQSQNRDLCPRVGIKYGPLCGWQPLCRYK